MNSIKQIARLNEAELQKCVPSNASWHTDYRDTAYIHIGGLPFELSEGDVMVICSQYGSPVHVNLVRDKDTGKSRGFAFLKYEDQRSCDLAVDNLSGAQVLGRTLSVDHARYVMKDGERETVGEREDEKEGGDRKRRKTSESESESEEESRPMIKEEVELRQLMEEHDEDDPMKAYLVQEKKAEVEEALKAVTIEDKGGKKDRKHRHKHRHHHRSRRDDPDERNERKAIVDRSRRKDKKDEEDESPQDSRSRRRQDDDRYGNDHKSSRRRRSPTPSSNEDEDRRRRLSQRYDPESEGDRPRKRREDD